MKVGLNHAHLLITCVSLFCEDVERGLAHSGDFSYALHAPQHPQTCVRVPVFSRFC